MHCLRGVVDIGVVPEGQRPADVLSNVTGVIKLPLDFTDACTRKGVHVSPDLGPNVGMELSEELNELGVGHAIRILPVRFCPLDVFKPIEQLPP